MQVLINVINFPDISLWELNEESPQKRLICITNISNIVNSLFIHLLITAGCTINVVQQTRGLKWPFKDTSVYDGSHSFADYISPFVLTVSDFCFYCLPSKGNSYINTGCLFCSCFLRVVFFLFFVSFFGSHQR